MRAPGERANACRRDGREGEGTGEGLITSPQRVEERSLCLAPAAVVASRRRNCGPRQRQADDDDGEKEDCDGLRKQARLALASRFSVVTKI
jgi:hypothetical protein